MSTSKIKQFPTEIFYSCTEQLVFNLVVIGDHRIANASLRHEKWSKFLCLCHWWVSVLGRCIVFQLSVLWCVTKRLLARRTQRQTSVNDAVHASDNKLSLQFTNVFVSRTYEKRFKNITLRKISRTKMWLARKKTKNLAYLSSWLRKNSWRSWKNLKNISQEVFKIRPVIIL